MKHKSVGILFFFFVLVFTLLLPLWAMAVESTCPEAILPVGALNRGETDAAVYADDSGSARNGKMLRKEQWNILGVSGKYYHISMDGREGYAVKSRVTLSGKESGTPLPAARDSSVSLKQYMYTTAQAKTIVLQGTVQWDAPVDTLFFFLWDERLQRVEQCAAIAVETPSASFDLSAVKRKLEFQSVSAGEKTVVLEAAAEGELFEVYRCPIYVRGKFKPVRTINDQCKLEGNGVKKGQFGKSWTPTASKPELTVHFPASGEAALMTFAWRKPPQLFSVAFYSRENQLLAEEAYVTGFYADAVSVPDGSERAVIRMEDTDNAMIGLCVYDQNHPDQAVQQWKPVPEKLDLMVFSAHQDDELLFLGGTIPYACALGADVGVVYMTNGGRSRYAEALDGLWTAGLRAHPIFMNWRDQKVNSINIAMKTWSQNGVDPVMEIVRLLRRYKPEVIVTQDLNGEYGHTQHKLTAKLVTDAVPLAKDPDYDQESAAQWGTWEVKKLYLHLYGVNRIEMDWDQPLEENGVITPLYLAQAAYDKHRSQQGAYNIDTHGKQYNNRLFGLYYSAVGADEEKNDFFEHITLHETQNAALTD